MWKWPSGEARRGGPQQRKSMPTGREYGVSAQTKLFGLIEPRAVWQRGRHVIGFLVCKPMSSFTSCRCWCRCLMLRGGKQWRRQSNSGSRGAHRGPSRNEATSPTKSQPTHVRPSFPGAPSVHCTCSPPGAPGVAAVRLRLRGHHETPEGGRSENTAMRSLIPYLFSSVPVFVHTFPPPPGNLPLDCNCAP